MHQEFPYQPTTINEWREYLKYSHARQKVDPEYAALVEKRRQQIAAWFNRRYKFLMAELHEQCGKPGFENRLDKFPRKD